MTDTPILDDIAAPEDDPDPSGFQLDPAEEITGSAELTRLLENYSLFGEER